MPGLNSGFDSSNKEKEYIEIGKNHLVMSNDNGLKLVFDVKDGTFGPGTIFIDEVSVGGNVMAFLDEDTHPGAVRSSYRAQKYEVLKKSEENLAIRFSGSAGFGSVRNEFRVTVTMPRRGFGYRVDYEVTPPQYYVNHPLYVAVPFYSLDMEFVQYAYETPLTREHKDCFQWSVKPRLSKVPFMIGCEKLNGRDFFVGVGYVLNEQHYTEGKLQYDSRHVDASLRIYFPYATLIPAYKPYEFTHMAPWRLSMVVSVGKTQSDCIGGYMNLSKFDPGTPIRATIDSSLALLMDAYKRAPYFPGAGYRYRAWADSDEPPSFSEVVPICGNVQTAYQLYKYWEMNPEEAWARERAIELAESFVSKQEENGAVPVFWDVKKNQISNMNAAHFELGLIYTTWHLARGIRYINKLYYALKQAEGIDLKHLQDAAIRGVDFIVKKIEEKGFVARNYSRDGKWDDIAPQSNVLIALDEIYQITKNKRYDRARQTLEDWMYREFVYTNFWYGEAQEDPTWIPSAPKEEQFHNIDFLEIPSFITYCAYRHMRTKETKYLQMACDVAKYA